MTRTLPTTAVSDVVVADERKKRSAWKPLAAAGIGGAVLVATGFGVFAQLNATATNTTPQLLDSGTLRLALNPDAAGNSTASFSTELAKVAPGDRINRLVTLSSTGTLAGQLPTLQVSDATPTPLTTDATRGLRADISRCSVAWTFVSATQTPTCSGTTTAVVSATLADLTDATANALTGLDLAPAAVNNLLVSVTLPNGNGINDETAVNGVLPTPAGGTIQGRTASLTWTFRDTQRNEQVVSAVS